MGITLQEMRDRGLLGELALTYGDETSARIVLHSIGFPENLIPPWNELRSFWFTVCERIGAGADPRAFEPLLVQRREDAERALAAIRFPAERVPRFSRPHDFWADICRLVDAGVPPGSLKLVLQQAAADFSCNSKFAPYR